MSIDKRIITLLTDFGISDGYVGIMKGVILGINSNATIVDISHNVSPQNIQQAAYLIDSVHSYYPQDAIHVVVVDPGVGTDRRAVILKTPEAFFVAPDNGVLSLVSANRIEIISITNPAYWLSPVSATFHGRDIFASVAAHLSLGVPLREFGKPITSLISFPIPRPMNDSNGNIVGQVTYIDHFGNLITNIKSDDLPKTAFSIEIRKRLINKISSSYADADQLLGLIGSNNYLEIGIKNGNANEYLEARCGDRVTILLHN